MYLECCFVPCFDFLGHQQPKREALSELLIFKCQMRIEEEDKNFLLVEMKPPFQKWFSF